ncbi:MAG: nucleotidyltransferase domain-containing protein [Gammaproteobacteria bacterium]|nr:nucleotidyltransferase domain-containing protein [Gammaproteobacteria bacterium]
MDREKIDLATHDLEIVIKILQQYIPEHEVRVFGSRITDKAKKFSDLDLVVMTNEPLSLATLADLVEAFSNSNLPIKVDVLDWARLSDEVREIISKKNVRLL